MLILGTTVIVAYALLICRVADTINISSKLPMDESSRLHHNVASCSSYYLVRCSD